MDAAQSFTTAVAAMRAGNLDAALKLTEGLVRAHPRDGKYRNLLAVIYTHRREFGPALEHIEKAVDGDGSNAEFRLNLASILVQADKIERSVRAYKAALKIKPDCVDVRKLGVTYQKVATHKMSIGDFKGAAIALQAILDIAPQSVDYILPMPTDSKIAVAVYKELARRVEHDPNVTERLAFALFIDGQIDAAKAEFDRTSKLMAPNDAKARALHEVYTQGLCATDTPPSHRRRLRFLSLMKVFQRAMELEGDVAECGCFNGLSAHVMMSLSKTRTPDFHGEGFHIFDSFEGLSDPVTADLEAVDSNVLGSMKKGSFAADYTAVREALGDFPQAKLYKGWIPERFPEVADRTFRFLNLDVDLYQPTRDSILFFFPRLVPGGIILVDDCNWPGCRKAIAECAAELNFQATFTAFDQAVITKVRD